MTTKAGGRNSAVLRRLTAERGATIDEGATVAGVRASLVKSRVVVYRYENGAGALSASGASIVG